MSTCDCLFGLEFAEDFNAICLVYTSSAEVRTNAWDFINIRTCSHAIIAELAGGSWCLTMKIIGRTANKTLPSGVPDVCTTRLYWCIAIKIAGNRRDSVNNYARQITNHYTVVVPNRKNWGHVMNSLALDKMQKTVQ